MFVKEGDSSTPGEKTPRRGVEFLGTFSEGTRPTTLTCQIESPALRLLIQAFPKRGEEERRTGELVHPKTLGSFSREPEGWVYMGKESGVRVLPWMSFAG